MKKQLQGIALIAQGLPLRGLQGLCRPWEKAFRWTDLQLHRIQFLLCPDGLSEVALFFSLFGVNPSCM